MKKMNFLKTAFLLVLTLFWADRVSACSMYKLTANGKTMVGNNEDSWGRDPKIWFIQRTQDKFGVVCVGYARKQPHPDGAMNEFGLAFDAFTMHRKGTLPKRNPRKKDFAYSQVLTIMQQCKTVDEVFDFLAKLNLHVLDGSPIFHGGMFLFVDKTGKYLVVEADKMTLGSENKFVLANFSLSGTKDLSTIKMERYCNGVAYLKNKKLDTGLSFCSALSDTMSVNRAKIGDGTLYTTIYDLNEGLIHLYFFHDYSKRKTFNLEEELSKGDHSYHFTNLFPNNMGFEKFTDYQTPQSNMGMFIFLTVCCFLFFFSFVFFLISLFRSKSTNYKYVRFGMALLSMALCVYSAVLLRKEKVFYFPSPYADGSSFIVAMTSYLPFVLLLIIIPLFVVMVKILRERKWKRFASRLIITNLLVYIVLIGLFTYWGLFDVFKN